MPTPQSALARSTWTCTRCRPQLRHLPRQILQHRYISIAELDKRKGDRERVVVLGSGWAGYTLSRELDPRKFQTVVVSPRSYFVFTPLLASCSVGTLEFRTALEPVRARNANSEFFQGWADDVDFDKRTLTIEEAVEDPMQSRAPTEDRHAHTSNTESQTEKQLQVKKGDLFDMTWDKLIISVGCYSQTFGTKGVKENAYFLKDVGDARRIRNRLLSCFESANLPTTSEIRKKQLLNFAVVGGGPTGIEFGGELYDIVHEDLARLYPSLKDYCHITVYDVAPTVLNMFDKKLSSYAMSAFQRRGIDIKTSHHVQELSRGPPPSSDPNEENDGKGPNETHLYTLNVKEEGPIGIGMCVWSTGLMMNPFVATICKSHGVQQHDKSGGILTNAKLQAFSSSSSQNGQEVIKGVYALGDCAILQNTTYPATAQVANQKALWLAKRLNKGDIEGNGFSYRDLGIMAYVGNWNAIVQSGGGEISGRLAWLIWRGAYLAKAVSWRNRILIPIYWFVNWVFGRDVSRF